MEKRIPTQIRLIQLALLFVIGFILYLVYLLIQPVPEVTVTEPMKLSARTYTRGEQIGINVEYCSPPNVRQRVEFQILDDKNTAYNLSSADDVLLQEGCHSLPITIDTNRFSSYLLRSGEYRVRLKTTTEVNAIRSDTKKIDSEMFYYNER